MVNHQIFFQKTGRQAASHKRQATGNRRAGGPIGDKRLIHRLSTVRVIHRLSTEKIFRGLLMGFSMKRWENEKSENDCTCQPTHAQIQPEKPRGVSGSNGKAQGQNLLCSRSDLSRLFKNYIPTTQTSKLWSCVLGRDRGGRDSLRLDRGSPGEASFHQAGAQDASQAWFFEMDQLGYLRDGQGRRPEIRYRTGTGHRLRNFKSCPELGQLQSSEKSYKRQAASIKRQATGGKHPSLRLQAGGWAHRLQALESRTLNKVSLIVDRGS
jgi:hypothetical protein